MRVRAEWVVAVKKEDMGKAQIIGKTWATLEELLEQLAGWEYEVDLASLFVLVTGPAL